MFSKSVFKSSRFFVKRSVIFTAMAASFCSPLIHAESPQQEETVYVSATRSETAQLPVASQIIVIGQEQIQRSGAKLVSDVLRNQMGIQLTDTDGSGARNVTVSMRGLSGTNNVLILVDGRKLNNANGSAPALNTVSLDDVARIEVMQGSAGVLYGDQAVAGVINIITKQAKVEQLHGEATATGGSFGLQKVSASVRQGFENGVSYSASLQNREADNFRNNNHSDNKNYLGQLRYTGQAGFIFGEVQSVKDDLRLPGALTDLATIQDPQSTTHAKDFSNQTNDIYRLGGGLDLSKSWQFLIDFADRDEKIVGSLSGAFTQKLQQKNIAPRFVGKYALNGSQLITTLGVDAVNAAYKINSAFGDTDATQEQRDIYGQVILPLSPVWTITTGARTSKVDDEANLINYLGESHKQKSQRASSTELGTNYQFDQIQVFARAAQGFRYANADDYTYAIKGFDFLLPQKSLSKEVGVNWNLKNLKITTAIYQMDLKNEIAYDPENYANVNLPSSERSGFNAQATLNLADWVDTEVNYTYTKAHISEGTFKGKDVPYVAANTANAGVNLHWIPKLNLWIGANYLGERYRSGDNANNQGVLGARTLLNANLRYQIIEDLSVSLRVNNISDKHYSGYEGYSSYSGNYQYPQPGRNFDLSLSFNF